jgi:hypothetical protein
MDNVKRVLVTSGNQAVAAKDSALDNLALGQIGVFDAETNLAIDATQTPANFYIAVGIDSDADGVVDDIKQSAGKFVSAKGISSYSFRPHTASRSMIVELQGIVDADVEVDKEFAVKFEFRNLRIYKLQGTNAFTHTYAVKSSGATAATLAQDFADAINANEHGFISAAVVADKLQVTADPLQVNRAINLNLLYNDLRETAVIPSAVEGFSSATAFATIQELAYEEGDGAQIRQLEFNETGVARPYVLSESTGTARDMEYNAVGGVKYDQTVLEYGDQYEAGWLKHINNLQTTIAVPATDTVTRDALVDILDAQAEAQGLDGKSEVAKSSDVDPAVVEESSDDATQAPAV